MAQRKPDTDPIPARLMERVKAHAPAYPYTIQARIATRHYAVILSVAERHDCSLSEALRLILEPLVPEHLPPDLARMAEAVEPDPAWTAKHGDES